MSSTTAAARATAVEVDVDPERRLLRPLEVGTSRAQRRARPKVAYALVATAALFVLLLAQLAISIALSDGAYKISALEAERTELARDQQKYSEQLDVLSSPQNLAVNAEALGMVRNSNPVYLDAATGAVHGDPAPAAPDADGARDNLIGNTLLQGVPVVAATPDAAGGAVAEASDAPTAAPGAPVSAATGEAAQAADAGSVPSAGGGLAAPETR